MRDEKRWKDFRRTIVILRMERQVQPKAGTAVVRISRSNSCRIIETDFLVAQIDRLSSPGSSNPEKREDIEIVDWNGPNDPGNPYEQNIPTSCRGYVDAVLASIGL
jgi:hypothetical protein